MRRWVMMASLLLAMGGAALPEAWARDVEDCDNAATLVKTEPAKAVAACRRLAEQGEASAQTKLGVMYDYGLGVSLDSAEAMRWYRRAADQGRAIAQFALGTLYMRGPGVPHDDVQAYMWFSLAVAQGNAAAAKARKIVAAKMTPAQIEQAKALAAAWKPKPAQ